MSEFEATGRLATWDGRAPDIRNWSTEEVLEGLAQLGIQTDTEAFAAEAAAAPMQSSMEDDWLERCEGLDQNLAVFVWMSVQELWERWKVPAWPKDRLARMFAYLVDSEYAVEWADRFHAPEALEIMDALEQHVGKGQDGKAALDELVEMLGMPAAAWPSKFLDSMAEWSEVGRIALAQRGGALMAHLLGQGDSHTFMAAALVSTRMYDRAKSEALQVPHTVQPGPGFGEMVGYLCLAAGDVHSARHWIELADKTTHIRRSELTFAAEAVRDFLAQKDGAEADDKVRKAAMQGAAQACYYAFMAFAGLPENVP